MRLATLVHDMLGKIVASTIAYYLLSRISNFTALDFQHAAVCTYYRHASIANITYTSVEI